MRKIKSFKNNTEGAESSSCDFCASAPSPCASPKPSHIAQQLAHLSVLAIVNQGLARF
jgi:hypothetical protein